MDIDFKKIRPLNNSRNEGFEELCCQSRGYRLRGCASGHCGFHKRQDRLALSP